MEELNTISQKGKSGKSTEKFNMALYYLETIGILIRSYLEFRFTDDFNNMYICIDSIETMISPKTDNDDIEKNIKWLEMNIDSYKIVDGDGVVTRIIPERKKEIRRVLNITFKALLMKMDNKEMLTTKLLDATRAMQEFE